MAGQMHKLLKSSSFHPSVSIPSTRAVDFAWGGIISIPGSPTFKTGDYWKPETLHLRIVVKEARALINVLKAGRSFVCNPRVDVHIDLLAFLQSWQKSRWKE